MRKVPTHTNEAGCEFDAIVEDQAWIDGLIEEYSPRAHDIDVALQNLGLEIRRLNELIREAYFAGYRDGGGAILIDAQSSKPYPRTVDEDFEIWSKKEIECQSS